MQAEVAAGAGPPGHRLPAVAVVARPGPKESPELAPPPAALIESGAQEGHATGVELNVPMFSPRLPLRPKPILIRSPACTRFSVELDSFVTGLMNPLNV